LAKQRAAVLVRGVSNRCKKPHAVTDLLEKMKTRKTTLEKKGTGLLKVKSSSGGCVS